MEDIIEEVEDLIADKLRDAADELDDVADQLDPDEGDVEEIYATIVLSVSQAKE